MPKIICPECKKDNTMLVKSLDTVGDHSLLICFECKTPPKKIVYTPEDLKAIDPYTSPIFDN